MMSFLQVLFSLFVCNAGLTCLVISGCPKYCLLTGKKWLCKYSSDFTIFIKLLKASLTEIHCYIVTLLWIILYSRSFTDWLIWYDVHSNQWDQKKGTLHIIPHYFISELAKIIGNIFNLSVTVRYSVVITDTYIVLSMFISVSFRHLMTGFSGTINSGHEFVSGPSPQTGQLQGLGSHA